MGRRRRAADLERVIRRLHGVRRAAQALGEALDRRGRRRFWTPSDRRALRARYPHEATKDLARDLGRSIQAVYVTAQGLGLRKTPEYLASPAACRLRRGDHPGRATQFRPGLTPANKGLRRPGWFRGRMRETQFRKGGRPHTWVPIGTEVSDPDGYTKRKVSDDRTMPRRFNWRFVHVMTWEQANGPVPPGHAVVFRNGDKTDIRLANLELVTRAELMRRNTIWNKYPKPLADTIHLRAQLARRIREREEATA